MPDHRDSILGDDDRSERRHVRLRLPIPRGPASPGSVSSCLSLDQCQARPHTAINRHLVLVLAALALCAVIAAQIRHHKRCPGPAARQARRPAARRSRLISLTVREGRQRKTAFSCRGASRMTARQPGLAPSGRPFVFLLTLPWGEV